MPILSRGGFGKVSQSPTNPVPAPASQAGIGGSGPAPGGRTFDVADFYRGPVTETAGATVGTGGAPALDEKLRQAYFWIANNAIISPFYDIEFHNGPNQSFSFGDSKTVLSLPSGQSYSSFVLLPLLNLVVRRRCLIVGGPGRGKTASAILIGVLAGYPVREVKRAIQHGQPQMTISDLLGNPLPADMIAADKMDDIRIAWRKWLAMRVKIIDEYNRIPTRTQSALLTVMADNYAEILDQIYECPEAAWYLTANDDAGGGTYQVIEALRDRIDVVVKALHFNTRFLGELLERIERDVRPETLVPPEIVFSEAEIDRINHDIRQIALPQPVRRRIEFFCSHFEFSEPAASQFEYMTKDTVKLSGVDPRELAARDGGKDRVRDLGSQTRNGISVRGLMTLIEFVKALAWFRGNPEVSLDDVRQMLPFVLHDKLSQDPDSPFFEAPEHAALRLDRVSWIRTLFDLSCAEYDRLDLDKDDPVAEMLAEFGRGLDGLDQATTRGRLVRIERLLAVWSKGRKLYGHLFDDLLTLKYLHQRYTNYLHWLQWQG
ncbi:MoxR-like ATPase [uncultured Gammaproteobacteria bacterium]